MIRQRLTEPDAQHHEKMALGSMLLDSGLVAQAVKTMKPEFFRVVKHRFIFEAIIALHRAYTHVGPMSVTNILTQRRQLGICGGTAYLAQLIAYVQDKAKAHHDAAIRAGVNEAGGKV